MGDTEDLEEQLFRDEVRESRQERRRLRAKDQAPKRPPPEQTSHLRMGRVLSITAQGYDVDAEGERFLCVLRRTLLQHKKEVKGLIAVGDLVYFEETGPNEGAIASLKERYSLLSRADSLQARRQHLIAANIDQVLITTSVGAPPLKPALVDRYIIAARKGGMKPVIVVNKADLVKPDKLKPFVELYSAFGYTVVPVSATTGRGLDELKAVMQGKASVFAGQSGVGKSSLINALTGMQLQVGDVVAKTRKGAHTTSRAQLIPLPSGGWCIDTPGIKSFGMWDLSGEEIADFFHEIDAIRHECQYADCSHTHEPDCAVIRAAEAGQISPIRYESYLSLLEEAKSEPRRR